MWLFCLKNPVAVFRLEMGSVIPASGMWLGNVLEIKHILSLVPNAQDSRM